MPQLDVTMWPPQLFWLAVTFIALYYIVSRVIIPKTGGVIERRRLTVENDLAAAQRLKAETDLAVKAYEAALAEARQKANAIAAENRDRLSAEAEAERAKLDKALAEKIAVAEKAVFAAKTKALADVQAVAADIASEIVNQLTGSKVSSAEAAAAVAKAVGSRSSP
jgi:F-type H+-transporting ATPase subunit b